MNTRTQAAARAYAAALLRADDEEVQATALALWEAVQVDEDLEEWENDTLRALLGEACSTDWDRLARTLDAIAS